eukprot:gene39675-5567_t
MEGGKGRAVLLWTCGCGLTNPHRDTGVPLAKRCVRGRDADERAVRMGCDVCGIVCDTEV